MPSPRPLAGRDLAGGDIDRCPVVGAEPVGAGLDSVGAGDVIDLGHRLAVGDPAFDDLDLLQRRAVGIARRPDDEARRFPATACIIMLPN